mmetsp:Transcript_45839/g.133457  ORF Transcript_45839/g.133457 Transcript_45839/m.133457 type:complete len:211 (+) Transcript_45839:159-791(+)
MPDHDAALPTHLEAEPHQIFRGLAAAKRPAGVAAHLAVGLQEVEVERVEAPVDVEAQPITRIHRPPGARSGQHLAPVPFDRARGLVELHEELISVALGQVWRQVDAKNGPRHTCGEDLPPHLARVGCVVGDEVARQDFPNKPLEEGLDMLAHALATDLAASHTKDSHPCAVDEVEFMAEEDVVVLGHDAAEPGADAAVGSTIEEIESESS